MKNLLIFIGLAFAANATYGQEITSTEALDSSNIYFHAMMRYCESNSHIKHIYLEENPLTTSSLPQKLGTVNIEIIGFTQRGKLLRRNNPLQMVRIVPLRVANGKFNVNIITFEVTIKKNVFHCTSLHGSSIIFKYNCSNNSFEFVEIN